jgi:hypothetical protein
MALRRPMAKNAVLLQMRLTLHQIRCRLHIFVSGKLLCLAFDAVPGRENELLV